ncbi:MAG: lysine--tRNA ligase [bacterium]
MDQIEKQDRLDSLKNLCALGIDPYPSRAERTHSCVEAASLIEGSSAKIVGRMISKRDMGKLSFVHVQDESGRIQIALSQKEFSMPVYKQFTKYFDIGDFVEFEGSIFTTHKGEISLLAKNFIMVCKAIQPLPEKFHGLQDEQEKLRKRYLDIMQNPSLKEMFQKKAVFWSSMRRFLMDEGFLEVETPVLETTPGGADAKAFVTHHDALDIDVYLRISMGELWQKRLMVAGFEKTFEIGRQFRNEGMSREHLQDYSQMEFYMAYSNYEDSMKLVEKMYKQVILETFQKLKFDIQDFKDVDFEPKWGTIKFVDEIKRQIKIDVMKAAESELIKKIKELKIVVANLNSRGRIIDALWKYCRRKIKGPVFLIDHPVSVSPLSKRKKDNPELTERFQIIIAGSENGNGYSELNDPIDQAERFEKQAELRLSGDIEAQMHDFDFVEALEYGMPPTTGFGVSERLFSFLADKSIRECVLFPLMKKES